MTDDLCAVIPAGGFGTRMLPATKSMPKEMLPVLDKPAVQHVVEEALAAACNEIIIVTGRHKRAVEDHFDAAPELESFLQEKGKHDALEVLASIVPGAELTYVRQDRPRGLGHAVLQAKRAVRDRPFVVLLGDDLVFGDTPVVEQLRRVHEKTGGSVLAVQRVPRDQVSKYGVVETDDLGDGLHRLKSIVEKPSAEEAPSDLASIGRYLFTPALFEHLERTEPGVGGEIQLTDAVQSLLADEEVYCLEFEGDRFDIGTLGGWLHTNIELAKRDASLKARLGL